MRPYTNVERRRSEENFEQQRLSLHIDSGEDSDSGHYEKPSERERFKKAAYNSEHVNSIPSYGLVILFGVLLLLGYLTSLIDDSMPRVISEEEAGSERFSEQRAWRRLRALVGDGPRVAGGRRHRLHTELLKADLDAIAAAANQTVRTDWQIVTGDYYLTYRLPYVNSYERASNVIAVIQGESGFNADGTTNTSILLNCHYDSVPTSPGASDNALFCAVMMETLHLLSLSPHKPKHNIVFLFNGAEENSLQASHGFLSHPWSKGVTGLVNLDSAGMNGKSVLFQVTDPRVLSAYSAAVPSPSAQALGETLFLSGLVPSDTDFRIFRDFGQIHGVDIAFNRYGHVYHTRYDSLDLVATGVIQHAGDAVYHLTRRMADMEEFSHKEVTTSTAVYYDYLYCFMLTYSFTAANVVDTLITIFGLSSVVYYLWIVGMARRYVVELFVSALCSLASLLAGCLLTALLTLLAVATSPQLRYYSNAWLAVPMYWAPYLLAAVAASHLLDRWRAPESGLNRSLRASQAMAAARLLWSALLLCLLPVAASFTMRYAIAVPLLLTSSAALLSLAVNSRWRLRAWQRLIMEVALAVPALLFVFSLTLKMDALMLPIMGRSLTAKPDYIVAALNLLMVVLSCMPLAGIELLFSRKRLWMVLSALGVLTLILAFLPLSVYNVDSSHPTPQRYNIFHTERITYDRAGAVMARSSGVWAGHTDINSPATLHSHANLTARAVRSDFTADCEQHLYCHLPTITPRTGDLVPFSMWIDFSPPTPFNPPPGLHITARTCSGGSCVLNFTLTGTPHVAIALWPREGVTLAGWSFMSPAQKVTARDGRPVYFVYHTMCTYDEAPRPPFTFTLRLEVASHLNSNSELLDVMFNAHKTHNEDELTAEFASFVSALPAWFNVAPYIANQIEYVF